MDAKSKLSVTKEGIAYAKDAADFLRSAPDKKSLDFFPWGLRLVAFLRPVETARGDKESLVLLDALEDGCKRRDDAAVDQALVLLDRQHRLQVRNGMRLIKGGMRLVVRPVTNIARQLIGKRKLEGTEGL